ALGTVFSAVDGCDADCTDVGAFAAGCTAGAVTLDFTSVGCTCADSTDTVADRDADCTDGCDLPTPPNDAPPVSDLPNEDDDGCPAAPAPAPIAVGLGVTGFDPFPPTTTNGCLVSDLANDPDDSCTDLPSVCEEVCLDVTACVLPSADVGVPLTSDDFV
ncbi:hypothetical protein, partial [Bartonella taylorii]|uniref:hypothetical protein n=1 Tax=Bartonella taylorii TaxID=33046 RepID=UPI001ABAB368